MTQPRVMIPRLNLSSIYGAEFAELRDMYDGRGRAPNLGYPRLGWEPATCR
jgi:hypothetical protein